MNDDDQKDRELSFWKKIRPNVLALMFLSYGSLLAVLFGLICFGVDPKEAFNLVNTPFVALIGGTLAVAKDLL